MREYQLRNPFAQQEQSSSFPEEHRLILTVTELTRQVQGLFADLFSAGVWVEGELSDPKIYPSGHLWFDLKDANSSLKSVMWRDDVRRLKFQPEQGLQVICQGKLDFYPARGEVKFVTRSIEPKGMGALQLAFEQMKEKLHKEGLFALERKRPLPAFPERIGIVTSPRGAAIDDMLKLLRGNVEILIFPARVQGDSAAETIVRGIRELNQIDGLDLLIVGRGGGSLEDLWAFNEEVIVRAIAASVLPVISAVGHEKDVTISDLVADHRAPTPTAAAKMIMDQRRNFIGRLAAVLQDRAFTEPEEWLAEYREQLEDHQTRLVEFIRESVLTAAHQLRLLHGKTLACSPQAVILQQSERLKRLRQEVNHQIIRSLEQCTAQFSNVTGRLQALSPLAVLERGYSITFDPDKKIMTGTDSIQVGDLISTRLHRGSVISRVEEKSLPAGRQEE